MRKRFSFKKTFHHMLMGSGAVLHPILVPRPKDPAAHDARMLQRDLAVVGQDLWDAVAATDAASRPSSRSSHPPEAIQNDDDADGRP
jgi:hypothetical protein